MGVGDRLEFERLGEGNYATWKGDMEAYLRRLALWRITSGSWLRPAGSMVTPAATSAQVTAGVTPSPVLSPPDPALVEKWEEAAEKAVGAILSAMEQSQRGLVSGLGDPKAVWDALAAHHEQKHPATRFASYEALLGIQKRDNESLPALAMRIEAALCSVKNACPTGFDLEQMHSDLACMALIRALPAKEFSSFRSLLLMKEEITLSSLTDALFLEEQNRKSSPLVDSAAAMAASSAPGVVCAFCDISGHTEANCFKKQSASAAAKAKTAEYAGKKRSRGKGKQKANAAVEASSSSAPAASTSDSKPSTTTANRAEFAGHASSPPLSPLPTGSDWIADTGATIHMTPHLHWF